MYTGLTPAISNGVAYVYRRLICVPFQNPERLQCWLPKWSSGDCSSYLTATLDALNRHVGRGAVCVANATFQGHI
jgi:hypothetical protein